MRIGIVGGSIAGCAAAAELLRDGHDVVVFERSTSSGQGAGIGVLPSTLATLIDRGLVPSDLPRIELREFAFIGGPDSCGLGRTALRLPSHSLVMHWNDLLRALRAHIPDMAYRSGVEVRGIASQTNTSVTLQFSDGATCDFDVVLLADGYRSSGRASLFPATKPMYRGYMLWRGLVPESELEGVASLDGTLYRVSYADLAGHAVIYSIPAGNGRNEGSERLVNYACYLPLPTAELERFLIDRTGRPRDGSLPPGSMRPEEERRLQALVREQLPPYFAALMARGRDTFAQPIYSVSPPRCRLGRVALLGDASFLAQPLTGSGVLKAISQASAFAAALRSSGDLEAALSRWDARATAMGNHLVGLGEHMERELIWNMLDLGTASESQVQTWWSAATTVAPES